MASWSIRRAASTVGLTALLCLLGAPNETRAETGYQPPTGEQSWAQQSEEYWHAVGRCAPGTGARQSPIDLQPATQSNAALGRLAFQYIGFSQTNPLVLLNSGHTVELLLKPLNYSAEGRANVPPPPGGVLLNPPPARDIILNEPGTIGGVQIPLDGLHFHYPSEHLLNGKRFAMELHLVHKATSPGTETIVVAVFLDLQDKDNAALHPLFDQMASIVSKDSKAVTTVTNARLLNILPADQTFVAYTGSLTTPPCTEGVLWRVLKTPIPVSQGQIDKFKNAIRSADPHGPSMNARPLQLVNGRSPMQSPSFPGGHIGNHLALYRPGAGAFWILNNDAAGVFAPLYRQNSGGNGIGGYDLASTTDRAIGVDYDGSGKLDHVALYRPATGKFSLVKKDVAGYFTSVYSEERHWFDTRGLSGPEDKLIAFDSDSSGKLDYLILYLPGRGQFLRIKKGADGIPALVDDREFSPSLGSAYDLSSTSDRMIAFDYDSSGKLDHLLIYRPGTGMVSILGKASDGFPPVYDAKNGGIGGYDLSNPSDRIIAFDYDGSGKMDHLVLYRPGRGAVWILKKDATGTFTPVYRQNDPGTGIAGYDLSNPKDGIIAFDYDNSGKMDHLVLYRPGSGAIWIVKKDAGGNFTPVYRQNAPGTGIGGYDLSNPDDKVMAMGYF
jgi:carbonic anhydrase